MYYSIGYFLLPSSKLILSFVYSSFIFSCILCGIKITCYLYLHRPARIKHTTYHMLLLRVNGEFSPLGKIGES